MALQVWLPLNKEGQFQNQGLADIIVTNNGATYDANGKIGGCVCLDSSKKIIFPSQSWMRPTNENSFSIAFWINISSFSYIIACNAFECRILSNHAMFRLGNGGSNTIICSYNAQFDTNTWYHFAATWNKDTKEIKLYINGECKSTAISSLTSFNNISSTINIPHSGSYKFNDFRLYDSALSPKQIREIAKGLVLHYPMNDEYMESTTNIIGSDTCGDLSNGTWGGHTHTSIKYTITSSDPVPFQNCQKHIVTYSGSGGGGSSTYLVSVPVKGNTTYCYSRYIKASDNFAYTDANFLYRYEYANGTYVTEAGVFSNSRKKYIGNGWYRCWGVFTTRPETTSLNLFFFTYPNKNVEYLLGGIQLEEKDHVTPYTPTTRNELVYDCSGYCNNGTVTGSLQVVDDSPRYRNSVSSNGNQKITAPIGLNIPSNNLTVSCWIKRPEVIDSYTMRCILNPGYTNNNRFYFRILSKGNTAIFNVGFGAHTYGTKTIDANWHHLAVTTESDGKTINIYVDGIKTNTGTEQNTFTIAGNFILLDYFIGKISDFRFYRTTLSEDDIKELYNTSAIINNNNTLSAYEFVE